MARALDELAAVPRSGLVRTRNALAARLRKAGHAREAAEIAARRRPSVVLWLVNRLARTDPGGIRRLLDASDHRTHPALRQGQLLEEIEPDGFEVLAGTPSRHLKLVKPPKGG